MSKILTEVELFALCVGARSLIMTGDEFSDVKRKNVAKQLTKILPDDKRVSWGSLGMFVNFLFDKQQPQTVDNIAWYYDTNFGSIEILKRDATLLKLKEMF